jgi:hypothetical protein
VIDGAGDKAIADRRQSKVQRHTLRRFDYQRFVSGDCRSHLAKSIVTLLQAIPRALKVLSCLTEILPGLFKLLNRLFQ